VYFNSAINAGVYEVGKKKKKEERFIPSFVRDVLVTIAAGIIIEPTLKALDIDITPYRLQWIWTAMIAFLIVDAIARNRDWVRSKRDSLDERFKKFVYPVSVVIASATLVVVWLFFGFLLTMKHRPHGPFTISHGPQFLSPVFGKGFFWFKYNGIDKITPLDVIAFYTITNVKSTPSLISHITLELNGAGQHWYELPIMQQHDGVIWSADLRKPTEITSMTFPAGFLTDKLANRPLAPGEPVQGWLLSQIPASYLATVPPIQMRLRVRDTAGDEVVQDLLEPSRKGGVLSMETIMNPVNDDISRCEIVPYEHDN
jgi:hypothetical protein